MSILLDITDEHGFDIASALRGPDSDTEAGYALKNIFTARLRWLTGLTYSNTQFSIRNFILDKYDIERDFNSIKEVFQSPSNFNFGHYLSHIKTACLALQAPKLHGLTQSLSEYIRADYDIRENYFKDITPLANEDQPITDTIPGLIITHDEVNV